MAVISFTIMTKYIISNDTQSLEFCIKSFEGKQQIFINDTVIGPVHDYLKRGSYNVPKLFAMKAMCETDMDLAKAEALSTNAVFELKQGKSVFISR